MDIKAFQAGSKDIYLKYYGLMEKRRWAIDSDLNWAEMQTEKADRPLQEMLYIASLIESYTFTTTPLFLQRHKDLPWIISLQMARGYEECKHGNALWRYLENLGYPVLETDLIEIQQVPDKFEGMTLFERNLYSWLSEIETTVFYRKVSEQLADPLGKNLLSLISADERVHGSFLLETIKLELGLNPGLVQNLQQILVDYQNPEKESHYGSAVGEATFREVRQWANQNGVTEEVGEHVKQKIATLLH